MAADPESSSFFSLYRRFKASFWHGFARGQCDTSQMVRMALRHQTPPQKKKTCIKPSTKQVGSTLCNSQRKLSNLIMRLKGAERLNQTCVSSAIQSPCDRLLEQTHPTNFVPIGTKHWTQRNWVRQRKWR